jgi:outer membrane lipoprotein-sorting protein
MANLRLFPILVAVLASSSVNAADSGCKPTSEANAKILSIPTHLYMTDTAGGKTRSSETIYLNNKTYFQVNSGWKATPLTDQAKKETAALDPAATCRVVRDEAVNGEAATVYSIHRQTADDKSDSQMWVSKSRGVPLKLEMDIDVGGTAGKSHRTIRYEYTNVKAPASVQ